jgi:bilirubin oxidase
MPDPNRRTLLLAAASALAALAGGALWHRRRGEVATAAASGITPLPAPTTASPPAAIAALRRPGQDGLLAEHALAGGTLRLQARSAAFALFDGAPTSLWHYAAELEGRVLANPLLTIAQGQMLDVVLANGLDEDTTIHWHGLHVDERNDGSGLHPVAPGGAWHYRFEVRNRAGLYLYHAHPHGRTGLQFQRGLASALLVVDDEELALRKRLDLGARDIPLLIADKQVNADNAIEYQPGADDWIGNRVLINWTPEPSLDVVPALYRFRLANVANARMFRIAFLHRDEALPMWLIGSDGGLLDRPWPIDDAFLAPAQRLDLLVDFSALSPGDAVSLQSLDYVAMDNEDESSFQPDPMRHHPGAAAMGEPLPLMQLRVVAAKNGGRVHSPPIPPRLSQLPALPDTAGWPVRRFVLRMDDAGRWLINDWNMHLSGHAPVFAVKRGAREVWEVRNSMASMPHPIHLHGFQFRVVERRMSPPDIRGRAVAGHGLGPTDLGLLDTVVVWPGETVAIALDFAQPYRGEQRYMLHCHNLEHEDMGMMITFAVDD